MRKLILIFLIGCNFYNAQTEKFEVLSDGNSVNPYVVTNIENKMAPELYKKTVEWISKNYNTPEKVIKAQVENNYIRIEGIKSNMFSGKVLLTNMVNDGKYQIEISFKDGKYKFEITQLSMYFDSQYSSQHWFPISLSSIKQRGKGKMQQNYPGEISSTFNSLNDSLKNYIYGIADTNKDNW